MDKVETKTETTNSLIVQKVFNYVSKYFVIIAGSLSGTTGLFTAVGFLAERSHLTMLGFTVIPINLELYLYTGAKFFAYLPIIIINAFGFIILNAWGFFIVLAILAIIWGIVKRIKFGATIKNAVINLFKKAKGFAYRHLSGILLVFMILQFFSLFQMFLAGLITNLLFEVESRIQIGSTGLISSTNELKFWILKNNVTALNEYFGKLFIMITILGLTLWLLLHTFRKLKEIKLNLWQNVWLGISILLFLTQLILLPVNYGILLLSNNFPVVEVSFAEDYEKIFSEYEANNSENTLQENKRLMLLYQDGNVFYLYYRWGTQPMVLYVKDSNIQNLVYVGSSNIFETP